MPYSCGAGWVSLTWRVCTVCVASYFHCATLRKGKSSPFKLTRYQRLPWKTQTNTRICKNQPTIHTKFTWKQPKTIRQQGSLAENQRASRRAPAGLRGLRGLRLGEGLGAQAAHRLRETLGVVRAAASRRGGSGQAWQGWAWCSSLGMPRMRAREFK